MTANISAMTAMARRIVNGNTGYNQAKRWTFYDRATDTFIPHKETDCSAMCGVIARAGTKKLSLGTEHSSFYTGNMEAKMVATGEFMGMAYPGAAGVREGDFLLKPGHVVYAVANNLLAEASIDENGKITGGKPGNQSGQETRLRPNWGGWTRLIRPITTKPKEDGFLMALTTAEQKELLDKVRTISGRVRDLKDYETQGGPAAGTQTISKRILAAVTDGVGVGAGPRARNIQDLITGGGPKGDAKSLIRDILQNQQEIIASQKAILLRLAAIEQGEEEDA